MNDEFCKPRNNVPRRWISRPNMAKRFGVTSRTIQTWERNPPPGYPLPADIKDYKYYCEYYCEEEVFAFERTLNRLM